MELKYSEEQRREYLEMVGRIGEHWLTVFGNKKEFYSSDYWDVLSRIWKNGVPVRKTDALNFMISIKSTHTAGKYLDTALRHGYLVETDNPRDARSKLVDLSPDMRRRLDEFFDQAVDELRSSNQVIEQRGTVGERIA